MNQSNQFQETKNETEVKYRNCDDMLARRLAGNYPGPAKRTNDSNYKQFITPGNPRQYMQDHRRNSLLHEAQEEKAEKDKERDNRNQRFEEIQTIKQQLKEEEDSWSNTLDDWKARRRSLTFDVRQRKEDRESMMFDSIPSVTPRRKAKTYREILEDKKKRDSGLYFHDHSTDQKDDYGSFKTSKKPYAGAASVPNIILLSKEPDGHTETNNNADEINPSIAVEVSSKPSNFMKNASSFGSGLPAGVENVNSEQIKYETGDDETKTPQISTNITQFDSATKAVKLRNNFNTGNNNNNRNNNNSLITPAQSFSGHEKAKDEVKESNTAVANRRSIYENIAAMRREMRPQRPNSIDLSTLLKRDGERLQSNGDSEEFARNEINSQSSSDAGYDLPFEQVSTSQEQSHKNVEAARFDHKPKIMPGNYNSNRVVFSPSRTDSQTAAEPVSTSTKRSPLFKSNTLPSRPKINTVEEKTDKAVTPNQQTNPFQLNFAGLKGTGFSPRRSPRGGSNGVEPLFEDLDISINQRPKCEKGFGFTVRGGDDGKPVVVNQVSPGGAAELSNLCVGDEILAINSVRLSSSLTQDDIVQLIVESVIKGSLLLGVRRYGKSKKASTPRWLGSSVLGSPRGFYPKSDSSPLKFPQRKTISGSHYQEPRDVSSSNFNQSSSSNLPRPAVPNRSLHRQAAQVEESPTSDHKLNGFNSGRSNNHDEFYSPNVLTKSQMLEQDIARREEEKRKRIEEAKAEEQKIADELRKIELAKQKQQREQDERKRSLLFSKPGLLTNGVFNYGERSHLLIEEAARKKPAKPRINIVEFTQENSREIPVMHQHTIGRNQS